MGSQQMLRTFGSIATMHVTCRVAPFASFGLCKGRALFLGSFKFPSKRKCCTVSKCPLIPREAELPHRCGSRLETATSNSDPVAAGKAPWVVSGRRGLLPRCSHCFASLAYDLAGDSPGKRLAGDGSGAWGVLTGADVIDGRLLAGLP